jgi:saccharopine dehydrogenase (NADP+, L-glutamate forming)
LKRILVLGAGQSSPFLIQRLLAMAQDLDWSITVADADSEMAASRIGGHARGTSVRFDVNDQSMRDAHIRDCDLVINMLPPKFLDLVAWDCVAHGRHMLSVSYRDEAVRDLDADARRQGILLLCELGLDPGIDHMSAMALIARVRAEGGRVRAFRSYGAGLPTPADAREPLRYAITWNPRNVVMSSEFGAQYMEAGRIKIVPWHHVFHHTWSVEVDGVGALEAYPNRDSLSYMQAFGLEHVQTMIRGTLRYPGWSETWAQIVALGLPNEQLRIPGLAERSYREVLEMFLPLNISGPGIEQRIARFLNISPTGRIMDNLRWLGLLSEQRTGCSGDTAAAMLIDVLQRKLPLPAEARDMVVLLHDLEIENDDPERPPERIVSTLVAEGEPGGFTAMAKAVGLPVVVAAKLLLTGKIDLRGAHIPLHPAIYEPELEELRREGLRFDERRSAAR